MLLDVPLTVTHPDLALAWLIVVCLLQLVTLVVDRSAWHFWSNLIVCGGAGFGFIFVEPSSPLATGLVAVILPVGAVRIGEIIIAEARNSDGRGVGCVVAFALVCCALAALYLLSR